MAVSRIWHQSTTEIDHIGVYKQSLIDRARLVLDADVELDVHGLSAGAYQGRAPSAALGNAYLHHRILEPILRNVIEAERQGYAAFVMGSFSDPFTGSPVAPKVTALSWATAVFEIGADIAFGVAGVRALKMLGRRELAVR